MNTDKEKNMQLNQNISSDDLKNLLFHLLRTFYQFENIEVTTFGLSYDLIYILKLLKRVDGMRISDIAEEMKIKVFTATRLVDQLEDCLLVKRARTELDRRNVRVTITSAGKKIVKRIEDHALKLIFSNMKNYSESEMLVVFNTIKNMDKILGIEPGRYNF
ncbi:MAG: MarR family transcriptional regulator [Spirochaetes bacterium]|nr:MarR family transcriptional regulator [Spirochaetota bacterium]